MVRTRATIRIVLIVLLTFALVAILVPLAMRAVEDRFIYTELDSVPSSDVALVLGASVVRGKPSPILESRANAAVQLYFSGKVKKILVTGDNSALSHDEVTPVRKYLTDAGIPARDIFLDHAGFDTYSSMYRAGAVFGATSVIVVTQDFHQPRALFLAHALGLHAYGFDAVGSGSFVDYVREIPASLKALLDLASSRVPKYLGEQIQLSGDGTATWY